MRANSSCMRWTSSIAGAGDSRPACTTSSASSPANCGSSSGRPGRRDRLRCSRRCPAARRRRSLVKCASDRLRRALGRPTRARRCTARGTPARCSSPRETDPRRAGACGATSSPRPLRSRARRPRAPLRAAPRAASVCSARLSGSSGARRPFASAPSASRSAASVANTGRSSSSMRSRPSGLQWSPLASTRSTRKRTNGTDASTASLIASGPSRCTSSAGSVPAGSGTTRSSSLRSAASAGGAQHRLLPGAVGVEREQHRLGHPRQLTHLLARQGGAHQARPCCACPPGAGRSCRCSPRTGSPHPPGGMGAREVGAVQVQALVVDVVVGGVQILRRPLVLPRLIARARRTRARARGCRRAGT